MLLNGDICEVNKHVVQLINICVVLDCAKSAEPESVPRVKGHQ